MYKSKHIRKLSSVPITHSPSTTRNAKSKIKSKNDDRDKVDASDLLIVDPPSSSKPSPNLPPSADHWVSMSKHIHKLSSIPMTTHPPSMTRNAKSKSKSKNDDQDKASASDLKIVDLSSTFKPPSKTAKPKPKSVSTP
eukprot:scaffold17688_cov37-Attheya_sp.AAC.2